MLPLLVLIDPSTLRPCWRKWGGLLLILGALPGVALGVALYQRAEPDVVGVLAGAVSIGFVIWQLSVKRGLVIVSTRQLPDRAGALAGFTSFISHAGGPPAAVYLLSKCVTKTQYQATTVLVFGVVNIAKFVPYACLGMFTTQTGMGNLMLAPFALLGAWPGVRAHYMVPEHLFCAVAYVLLSATGGGQAGVGWSCPSARNLDTHPIIPSWHGEA